jgi:hypothetical protein
MDTRPAAAHKQTCKPLLSRTMKEASVLLPVRLLDLPTKRAPLVRVRANEAVTYLLNDDCRALSVHAWR